MKLFGYCFIVVLCISCNNTRKETPGGGEVPSGGPCSYKQDTFPARVVNIKRLPNSPPAVFFEVQLSGTNSDTVVYSMVNNRSISEEEITRQGVKTGAVFQYIVSSIVSGSCNPHVNHLELEPYNNRASKPSPEK